MRILHVGKFYAPSVGGIETILRDLCESTASRWEVHVAVSDQTRRGSREMIGGVRVVRTGALGRVCSVPLAPTLPLALWRNRFDCVVLHEPNPLAAMALAVRRPASRLVVWHHSDVIRPRWAPAPYRAVQRRLYGLADCVIFSSPRLATSSPASGFARRRVVIPFGIALERFLQPDAAQISRAAEIRAATPGPRVLAVGRLVYYKGLDVLIRAMARSRGSLLLVGGGPQRERLATLAASLGIGARVRFVTGVSDAELPAYYHAAEVFALPSTARSEAFGIVQVEAMASGLPVVSTDLPTGVPWVNQHGRTGLVVPPGDVDALAAALGRLTTDEGLRGAMGRAGRVRAIERFARERMVSDFTSTVEAVVAGRSPRLAGDLSPA